MTEIVSIAPPRALEARLPCPVCALAMEKARLAGNQRALTLDHCTRCGGVWFDRGEVTELAAHPPAELWAIVTQRQERVNPPCHKCGAPLGRDHAPCLACGHVNDLACPTCDERMSRRESGGLTLDVCPRCRGVWFDHHELAMIWQRNLDQVVARRSVGESSALGAGVEVLGHAALWSPGLVVEGAAGLAHLGGAAINIVGEAAGAVFEAVVEIIASIFDA